MAEILAGAAAVIQVAPIVELRVEQLAKQDASASYVDYMIWSHYERDGSTYAAGLTSALPFNGSLVGIFRLAAPTLIWVVEWTATMVGEYPPIPDPHAPVGWTLLDATASPAMIKEGADGVSPALRIKGTYVYAKASPSSDPRGFLTVDVSYPYAPWIENGVFRKIPPHMLIPGLLDPSGVNRNILGVAGGAAGAGQGAMGPLRF